MSTLKGGGNDGGGSGATSVRPGIDAVASFCRRRGFAFPSADVHHGPRGFFDFGPPGAALKSKVRKSWTHRFVRARPECRLVETSLVSPEQVWAAAGHLTGFGEGIFRECKSCGTPQRVTAVGGADGGGEGGPPCAVCGSTEFDPAGDFSVLFSTKIGSSRRTGVRGILRPETCQGIFLNTPAVARAARLKLPFGIAQVGRAFRNEMNPGEFLFRTREFEQMELEYFLDPREGAAGATVESFAEDAVDWLCSLGVRRERLRKVDVEGDDLAHYASRCIDIEYEYPFGWREIAGVAHRGTHDLDSHGSATGNAMTVEDHASPGRHLTPEVVEPSFGLDRVVLALLCEGLDPSDGGAFRVAERSAHPGHSENGAPGLGNPSGDGQGSAGDPSGDGGAKGNKKQRDVLRLHPDVAPVRVAVLPLRAKRDGKLAEDILRGLLASGIDAESDRSGSIGRRYTRQDEVGTPFAITVDERSAEDATVTLRERDSMEQVRIAIDEIEDRVAPPRYMS